MFQGSLPVLHNGDGILTRLYGLKNLPRTNEPQRLANLKFLWIEPVKGAGDLYSKGRGVQNLPVEESNLDTMTQVIRETAAFRCEIHRHESDPLNVAVIQV